MVTRCRTTGIPLTCYKHDWIDVGEMLAPSSSAPFGRFDLASPCRSSWLPILHQHHDRSHVVMTQTANVKCLINNRCPPPLTNARVRRLHCHLATIVQTRVYLHEPSIVPGGVTHLSADQPLCGDKTPLLMAESLRHNPLALWSDDVAVMT